VRGADRLDGGTAVCFALAAAVEAVARDQGITGLLAFQCLGAAGLLVLAVRRRRPVLTLCVLTAFGLVGTLVQLLVWPQAEDAGGVWILGLMLAAYSLGAHARGPAVALGVALPLLVVVASDVTTTSGWQRVSGIVFVTVFVGLLPTAVGRLVRMRQQTLATLRRQQEEIEVAQRRREESAALAERVRTAERLQPTVLEGLRRLAADAEAGAEAGTLEAAARELLTRTREEVVRLTTPVTVTPEPAAPIDLLPAVRLAAQRWVVLGAGAVTTGLVVETLGMRPLGAPPWTVAPTALTVGLALALAWWRPVAAVAVSFVATALWSRVLTPLDGSLSETALAMGSTFVIGALTRSRAAVLGLAVCLVGQLVGVGTDDRLGEALALVVVWLGGRAVSHVSLLVERTRANNETLRRQEPLAVERALLEERFRLARDLHDAMGHTLTVITLQAGAARRLARAQPERAREVAGTVADLARDGLASLTRGTTPDDLEGLVARVRAAGLVVETDVEEASLQDTATRLTVVRIVRECLTNVMRHAPGARAAVIVRRDAGLVEVRVSNTPASGGSAGAGGGRGLAGIRERLDACSGRVTWGPLPDGGFEVRAVLPVSSLVGAGP
jgi:signal transduction histidine kinase